MTLGEIIYEILIHLFIIVVAYGFVSNLKTYVDARIDSLKRYVDRK